MQSMLESAGIGGRVTLLARFGLKEDCANFSMRSSYLALLRENFANVPYKCHSCWRGDGAVAGKRRMRGGAAGAITLYTSGVIVPARHRRADITQRRGERRVRNATAMSRLWRHISNAVRPPHPGRKDITTSRPRVTLRPSRPRPAGKPVPQRCTRGYTRAPLFGAKNLPPKRSRSRYGNSWLMEFPWCEKP